MSNETQDLHRYEKYKDIIHRKPKNTLKKIKKREKNMAETDIET